MDKQQSQRLKEDMKTACENNHFDKVFELIKAGQDPRHALPGSQTPLHYAAFHGNLEVVRALVEEHGCNPRSVDSNKCTPLHYACYGGNQDIVKYLVTVQKCDPHLKGHEGHLPLHFTCIHEELSAYDHPLFAFGRSSSLLFEEPTRGHFEIAKFLIMECGCNVTDSHKHGPPLIVHLACRYGTATFVQFLIEQKNCPPNGHNKDKDTPVHLASKYGHVEILRYLVETKHCSLLQQNKDGNTPLHLACKFQHLETTHYLVRKQRSLTMVANHLKELPTHIACCDDSPKIVQLVTSVSNVIAKACNGITPLHMASALGCLEVVKWLIEEMHCDPNIEDGSHLTPLHCACGHLHGGYSHIFYDKKRINIIQTVEYLVANCGCDPMLSSISDPQSSLMQTACTDDLGLVKPLTSNNVNCVDRNGNTPLHLACTENNMEVVQFLVLERHCRQDVPNIRGEIPLHIACSSQEPRRLIHPPGMLLLPLKLVRLPPEQVPPKLLRLPPEVVKLSLELVKLVSNCDINIQTKIGGDTPVHIACRHYQNEIVTYLTQERHCDLNVPNLEGELPLHIACQQKSLELVKLVSNCDINIRTKIGGDTPVHIACRHYQNEIVTYLTQERHCDLNIPNLEGELPLHIACQQKSLELVKIVSSCNLHAQTSRGFTPMHIACKNNAMEIIEYLVQERHCEPSQHFKIYDDLLIHCACAKGSSELVRKLANPTNVNTRFPTDSQCQYPYTYDHNISEYGTPGSMPLHEACKGANVEVVKMLVKDFHCDRAVRNADGELPLHLACSQQSLEIVELVGNITNPTVHVQNKAGDTPLHIACKHGQVDIVRYLTEKFVCDFSVQNSSQKLPVHYACEHSLEMVELVSDCDLESRISHGVTPLHIACQHGNKNIVRYLIEEKKCNPDVENSDGLSLLDYACGYTAYNRPHSISKKELDDEGRQAQSTVVRYLMNKHDYDLADVLPLFIKACEDGNLGIAKLFCTNTDIVNSSDTEGNTPLHIACMYKHLELVKFLTEDRQCSHNVKNQRGELPLHIACCREQSSSLEMIKLVSTNSDVNAQTVVGDTPLHFACHNGVLEVVQYLTEQCQSDQTIQNKEGELPLHIACDDSSLEVVKLVCSCNVNAQTINSDTPLHIVCHRIWCRYDPVEIAEFLFHNKGADPCVLNGHGYSPIHEACRKGDLALVKTLAVSTTINYQDEHGNTPLHIACDSGCLDVARFLINEAPRKADQSIQNHHGDLALHIACKNCSLPLTKLLNSCDPNVKNAAGNTPLHVACKKEAVQCVKYLVEERRCDASVQNVKGKLPLHIAANRASLNVVKLVSHCEVNSRTASGDTPLHIAIACIESDNLKTVQYLVKVLNCDPNIQNKNGELPLHIACQVASLKLVKLVSNCDPDTQTSSGDTALHLACLDLASQTVSYLLEQKHCNPNIQNANGETPLHIVCQNQDLKLVKLIGQYVCNPNVATLSGDTPLHVACRSMKRDLEIDIYCHAEWKLSIEEKEKPPAMDIINYLIITKNCNLKVKNNRGELPLHLACRWSVEHVKLVSNCNINSQTLDGNTPLHIACKENNIAIIKYLTKTKQCDVNIQNEKGELPLHIACAKDNLQMAMLVRKCNINAVTTAGDTALHLALSSSSYRLKYLVKFLISFIHCDLTVQNNSKELPLHTACQNGCSLDVVELVSECDVEVQTVSGDTPLLIACRRGIPDIVEYLIKRRHCNPRAHNSDNELPLHAACEKSEIETVKLVSDCDVNTQTLQSGETPLHYACRNERNAEDIVKYLIEEKFSNPSIQNNNGQLPLHIACSSRNISFKLVELLSNCDADFNCRTLTGDTPLHEACKVSTHYPDVKQKVIQFLIEKKHCDPNCRNDAGMTPLHYICKMNARETALFLLSTAKVRPSVTTKNSEGQTPVMLTDDIEIIRELLKHGADPHPLYQKYEQFFSKYSSATPPPTPFSVLVVGNASTGKTTLIESLKAEGQLVIQDTSPDAHTAGIIPNPFESKEYGLVTFYDFAGQHEYYAGHEAVIRIIVRSTPPAILLLVDISESEDNVQQKLLYWLSFISNQFPNVSSKPHLIITGSHADVVVDNGGNPHTKIASIIDSIKSQLEESTVSFIAFTTMDCRVSESQGISGLRQCLQKSSKELKDHGVMNFISHCFHIYLLEYFQDLPAVSLSQITSCMLQQQESKHHAYYSLDYTSYYPSYYQSEPTLEYIKPKRLLPAKPSEIDGVLEELNEKGHIVFLKSFRRRFSWVILNKGLFGDINGTVFAPKVFKKHKTLASSTGVVPFSTIASHFPKHDPNMIVI